MGKGTSVWFRYVLLSVRFLAVHQSSECRQLCYLCWFFNCQSYIVSVLKWTDVLYAFVHNLWTVFFGIFALCLKKKRTCQIFFGVYLFSLLKCTHPQPYLASIKKPSMTYLTFSGGGYVIAGNPHPQTYTLIFRLGCIFYFWKRIH